ncbi:AlbA family DNA-binding domain-containing protein [Yeosuana sp. AK3]
MNNKYPFYYEVRFKLLVSDKQNNIRTEKFTKVFKKLPPLFNRKEAFKAFDNYLSMLKVNDGLDKNEFNNYSIKSPTLAQNGTEEFENSSLCTEFYQEIGVYLIIEDSEVLDILDSEGFVMFSHKLSNNEKLKWEIEKEKIYNELKKKYKSNDPNFLDVEDIEDTDAIIIEKYMFGPQEFRHKNECLIHCVNSEKTGQFWNELELMPSLENEYKIYQHYKIDVSNYVTEAYYWESKEFFSFLETPFNWRPKDLICVEVDESDTKDKIKDENKSTEDDWYLNRIKNGESKSVEFKYNMFKNYKKNIIIKDYIPRTICGFLNTKGGILFVGVEDNGTLNGIEDELNSFFVGQNEVDLLYRTFDTMLRYHFDASISPLIELEVKELGEKKILAIQVEESYKPIFMNNEWDKESRKNKTTFYERMNASTRPINDVKEIVEYVFNKKWKNRPINE